MIRSQFSILMSNLFLIGGIVSWNILPMVFLLFFSFLWFVSAIYCTFKEREEYIQLKRYIEEYNTKMAERFKRGRR